MNDEIWSDAEVVGRDGADPCVWICGIDVRGDMDDACLRINAAARARERAAAAKALRDAVLDCEEAGRLALRDRGFGEAKAFTELADLFSSRADAVERGEA